MPISKISLKQLLSPNIDLIKGIIGMYHKVRKNNGLIQFTYIEGHQDKKKEKGHKDKKKENLSDLAALNVEADLLATKGLAESPVQDSIQTSDKAILYLDNKRVAYHHKYFI
jgi:Cu/Zn superoxide dismutase